MSLHSKVLSLVLVGLFLLLPAGAMGECIDVPTGGNPSLEEALWNAKAGDTINLTQDINSTMTPGNTTFINKNINISVNGFSIYLNGSLVINGSDYTILFNTNDTPDQPTAVTFNMTLAFADNFTDNASAIHIIGNQNNISLSNLTIDGTGKSDGLTLFNITGNQLKSEITIAGLIGGDCQGVAISGSGNEPITVTGPVTCTKTAFNVTGAYNNVTIAGGSVTTTRTAVNITGDHNELNLFSGSITSDDTAINITGNSNTIIHNNGFSITSTSGTGINLSGDSNTLTYSSGNISAAAGRLFLDSSASGNHLTDNDFSLPSIYIHNKTKIGGTTPGWPGRVWYFFNDSWSINGGNMHVSINLSSPGIPITGNVGLKANFTNVTGNNDDFLTNTSLAVSDAGNSTGYIFNSTEKLIFRSMVMEVPVNFTFGDNHYGYSGQTYYRELPLGSVVIVNFNPVNSLPDMHFNVTGTRNWTDFENFSYAYPSFVVENASDHSLLGNITFTEPVDLTSPTVGQALQTLGQNLIIAARSINLTMANDALKILNRSAVLTTYLDFPFSDTGDLTLSATADDGTEYLLMKGGNWLDTNRSKFMPSNSITIGTNYVRFPVSHFSKYSVSGYINANFTGTPTSGAPPLDVVFNDTSTGGTVDSWLWDFGDGGTSTETNPTHTYESDGTYTVTLTVTNTTYGSFTKTRISYISVSTPPTPGPGSSPTAQFTASPTSGDSPLTVAFTDQSTGTPSVYAWWWDFGDGSEICRLQNPTHTYTTPGQYDVSLTVTNGHGESTETKSSYIKVGNIVDANFTASPTSGNPPLRVNFTDMSTGSPTSWSWDFGDGNTSTEQNPSHTYVTSGVYTVTLTVENAISSDSLERADYITVGASPVADFTGSPTNGTAPLTVTFTDQSTGSPTSWSWDFGDGNTSTEQNPIHTYVAAGTYDVNLTVSNNVGTNTALKPAYITVNGPGEISSIVVSPGSRKISVGESYSLSAVGQDETGIEIPLTTAEWTSSNTSVATVTGSAGRGTVNGIAAGTATIRVSQDGVTGTATVYVYTNVTDAYRDPTTCQVTKELAVQAVNDYLFNDVISKEDALEVVIEYLWG
ncbi:MAG: beta strand repeat-containing protein [Methanoculleaceae archaeon]